MPELTAITQNRSLIITVIAVICFIAELTIPKIDFKKKDKRIAHNIILALLSSISIALISQFTLKNYSSINGLFHYLALSPILQTLLSILILDFFIYIQHRASHKIPIFWKLHRIHHLDRRIDLSSGFRFHTLEIILSFLYKLLLIQIFSIQWQDYLLFEIILTGMSFFTHSNIRMPKKLNRILQFFIVTPSYHLIHHSIKENETNSRYCFFLTIWDKLLGTYSKNEYNSESNIVTGLENHHSESSIDEHKSIWDLLMLKK